MNSVTYLGPQVYEIGQIKDSKKIILEPLLSIVQFLISDMKSQYCQNKSQILSRSEFTDIDKKFGNNSALQKILLERKELDQNSIIHFINKARRLTKQFHNESQYSPILNKLQNNTDFMKAQTGKDIFQYQFDLIKENINFVQEIYVLNRQYDQRVQDSIQIILDLLIYNIALYISEFTTFDFSIQEKKIIIQYPNANFSIEPLHQEIKIPEIKLPVAPTRNIDQVQDQNQLEPARQGIEQSETNLRQNEQSGIQSNERQQNQQGQQPHVQARQEQQQSSQQQSAQYNQRYNTERYSIESNNSQSPKRLIKEKSSQRNHKQEFFQNSQQFSTNENQQFQPSNVQVNVQQQQPPDSPHINQNLDSQKQNSNMLGQVLQKKQDQSYFKQPIFLNNKPRRIIFFNFTEPHDESIKCLCSIFQYKPIFYSCDKMLLYVQHQDQSSFILKIQQFINTEVICYSTDIVNNQSNYQEIQNLILNDQNLKQILNLRDNQIIYNIIVDDLRSTLIEQFNIELDEEIIQCL